ncbi:MAG: hypothetical protein ABL995_14055 [Bryobacteraceae bacterium]
MRTKWNRFAFLMLAVGFASSAYAVQFRLASVNGSKWTYTLTYDSLDNYRSPVTITLSGLSGVVSATGPTSTDFPAGSLASETELAWVASVQGGGTTVVWTQNSGGTGNYGDTHHAFGFSVTANNAVAGTGALLTNGFCIDDGPPCTSLDISTRVQAPVAPNAITSSGSMAQVAIRGGWATRFTLVNNGTSTANAQLSFYGDDGATLHLPFTFPQGLPGAGAGIAPTPYLSRDIAPGASFLVESSGDASASQLTGWAQLLTSGKVDGFGIFKYPAFNWEAVVPLETRGASSYYLAFDNTGLLATGVAVSMITQGGDVNIIIRDDSGAQIGTGKVTLESQGHTSFLLNDRFPITASKRGTVEFVAPASGRISVLGLRANGPALTTLPVLANGATSGGSIAHVTFNSGFTSSIYLVNTGAAPAQFTISYYAEDGSPLSVPMYLPQTAFSTAGPTLTRTLAAGAMLEVDTVSQETLPTVSGSAILATTGTVSGFEIFRWTTFGQEASVPLETRTPTSFVLAFDNTNDLTTGVALSVVSANSVNIPVKINDDTGATLQTTGITLGGHGHVSFLLPNNFAAAQNKRGTVEFTVPSGAQIAVIGLRAKADGTLTTIPMLVK